MTSEADKEEEDSESARPAFQDKKSEEQEILRVMQATISKDSFFLVTVDDEDAKLLESKGFGVREEQGRKFHLKDYETLYLLFVGKLRLSKGKEEIGFEDFSRMALSRDKNSMTRFLIFRDLRSRGYVVREGFGFPIDFRVYDRGDYGSKAARYIVFGLNEGKTMSMGELRKNIEEMSTMGKEAVVAVVERRGEVIYYKVGKWHPVKSP